MNTPPSLPRRYDDEAVKGILERALELQGRNDFARTDLEAMARQLGISPEQLARAEAEWFHVEAPDELAALRKEYLSQRRRHHLGKLIGLAATMLFLGALVVLDTPLGGIAIAFLFITFFSAIGTVQQSMQALVETGGEEVEKGFDQWLAAQQERRALRTPPHE